MSALRGESLEYAEMFGLANSDAAFFALFKAIRTVPVPLNLKGAPFVLRSEEVSAALRRETGWRGLFTMKDLEKAVTDDFLDAARGSTDNRKGWKITDVSQPRGESFHEARMTYGDVLSALGRGTVIFNAAGAHVPKLAGPTLAACDGALAACALNLYVTQQHMRTSAPPHTDKQDVVVVQTTGRKHWRVYSPPAPSVKPHADPFGRGKGDDSLPLYSLQEQYGCELLLEAVLNPGDALFVPAGFPHTTSTAVDGATAEGRGADRTDGLAEAPSIHLTLGIDHHIWELDYLCARRLGLRRAGVDDTALDQARDGDNPYVGKVNELPPAVWRDLLAELPLGLLDDDDKEAADKCLGEVAETLRRLNREVDAAVASHVSDPDHWAEVARRFQEEGRELLEVHRDMYLAAVEEGRKREMEEAMTSHLHGPSKSDLAAVMSPERMQRLSLFRVKRYYDRINESKAALKRWSYEGAAVQMGQPAGGAGESGALPADWALTMPVKVGDPVEADLGGAYFSAKVIQASGDGSSFDVQFFDGDVEAGLSRSMLRLLSPPRMPSADSARAGTAPPNMTAKQLKRWKKQQQEKLNKGR